jgi:hypothetical protein
MHSIGLIQIFVCSPFFLIIIKIYLNIYLIGSTLGCYDGNVYERLLDFARNSNLNKKQPVDQFEKYLKPFVKKLNSKL